MLKNYFINLFHFRSFFQTLSYFIEHQMFQDHQLFLFFIELRSIVDSFTYDSKCFVYNLLSLFFLHYNLVEIRNFLSLFDLLYSAFLSDSSNCLFISSFKRGISFIDSNFARENYPYFFLEINL